MNNKRTILFSILAGLGLALVFVALFVPMVQIVGHAADAEKTIVYNNNVSFLTYLTDNPFLLTAAGDVYFDANGPIWMATGSILLNLIVAVLGVVMFCVCLIEIVLCTKDGISIKDNLLAKKLSLLTGVFSLIVGVFAFVSFLVTTKLSNGYVEFYSYIEVYVLIFIGLLIIILSSLSSKRKTQQNVSKLKNSLGFGLAGFFSLISVLFVFIPQYSIYFLSPDITSIWQVAGQANYLETIHSITNMAGVYPFGIAQWIIFLIGFIALFVFICSITGFVFALRGKKANWLSARVKRWSMLFVVCYMILYVLIMCQHAVLYSSFVVVSEYVNMLTPQFFALMFIPFVPYIASTLISFNKKEKAKEINEEIKENKKESF